MFCVTRWVFAFRVSGGRCGGFLTFALGFWAVYVLL